MTNKILLLSLETFRAAGGIQRMNRILAHTLCKLRIKLHHTFDLYSLCDHQSDLDAKYISEAQFKAFHHNKLKFTWQSIRAGKKADLVILSHINLSLIGWIIRVINPKCQIWLIAHGIEVWRPVKLWKKLIWDVCDRIICVSRFTQQQITARHGVAPNKCVVINNVLDPFITLPDKFEKPEYLQDRYHIKHSQKVIFTLTRISASEHYKGYDLVLQAISGIQKTQTDIMYILAGPYDSSEQVRLLKLAQALGLEKNFVLTGYISDQELTDHFLLADLFVLPSKKEGFGIVFIEAMAAGLPVICGNADGSVDAVRTPGMGTAIDPNDAKGLQQTIFQQLKRALTVEEKKGIQAQCLNHFNQNHYMQTLETMIRNEQIT